MLQEVFQDGNDKLILEALVNFFFMGEDCADQARFACHIRHHASTNPVCGEKPCHKCMEPSLFVAVLPQRI